MSILASCAIVFPTAHIQKTAGYYRDVLGFKVVEHYDHPDKFAALYRGSVEILLVQSRFGMVVPNQERYGAGYDAYLVPESPEAVISFYEETRDKGAKIVQPPALTSYGSIEFVLEDVEGRLIGVGCIKEEKTFFEGVG